MRECVRTILNIILATLPVVCIILFALSVGALGISLKPDVKWNEYNTESYGFYSYYFNTLWSSLDGFSYARTHGNYLQVLTWEKINGTKIFVHDGKTNTMIKGLRVVVFNATFNNISVISWRFNDEESFKVYRYFIKVFCCTHDI